MFSRILRIVTPALMVAIALVGAAHPQWHTDGELIEDSPNRIAVGDFGAMLMLTNDADGLFKAWSQPPSPDYAPNISIVSDAKRGEIVLAFILFSGCTENLEGNCDTEVEYTAYFPNGDIYGQHSAALWVGNPDPGRGSLQLSEGNLGLRIEPDDPFGKYRITATVLDNVSGVKFSIETELTVVESE